MSVKTSYKRFYGNPTSTISFRKVIVFLRFFCWKYLVLRSLFCLAEAFTVLGMRNGWQYLIANLTVLRNLLGCEWRNKSLWQSIENHPIKYSALISFPVLFLANSELGGKRSEYNDESGLRRERENNDLFITEPFFLHSFCLGCRCFANVCKLVLHNRMTRRSIQLHQEQRQKCW